MLKEDHYYYLHKKYLRGEEAVACLRSAEHGRLSSGADVLAAARQGVRCAADYSSTRRICPKTPTTTNSRLGLSSLQPSSCLSRATSNRWRGRESVRRGMQYPICERDKCPGKQNKKAYPRRPALHVFAGGRFSVLTTPSAYLHIRQTGIHHRAAGAFTAMHNNPTSTLLIILRVSHSTIGLVPCFGQVTVSFAAVQPFFPEYQRLKRPKRLCHRESCVIEYYHIFSHITFHVFVSHIT